MEPKPRFQTVGHTHLTIRLNTCPESYKFDETLCLKSRSGRKETASKPQKAAQWGQSSGVTGSPDKDKLRCKEGENDDRFSEKLYSYKKRLCVRLKKRLDRIIWSYFFWFRIGEDYKKENAGVRGWGFIPQWLWGKGTSMSQKEKILEQRLHWLHCTGLRECLINRLIKDKFPLSPKSYGACYCFIKLFKVGEPFKVIFTRDYTP